MAKLSKEEQRVLNQLKSKAEAPDEAPASKRFNISVDLGDPKQVAAAHKLGLTGLLSDDDDDEEVEDGSDDPDDTPKRRGYFNE